MATKYDSAATIAAAGASVDQEMMASNSCWDKDNNNARLNPSSSDEH